MHGASRPRTSGALRLLVVMAVGLLLFIGQAAFIPVALALLLSLILATPVEALYRRGLPRGLSAALILVLFLGMVGETVELLWTPAQNWWASAPQTIRTIEKKVRPVTLLVSRISALSHRATEIVAALLNFIPYVGSTITLLLLTVTAFVTFNSIGQVAAVAGSYLVLATIEGQIAQPLIVGRRLRLNPVIVFLALWFGGWFWGIAGIVMAVPGLVILKVVAEHSSNGKALEEFLGPTDSADARAAQLRAALRGKKRAR